jgi:hypothetical protein
VDLGWSMQLFIASLAVIFKDIIAIFRSSHFFLVATLEIRRFVTEENVFLFKWNAF